MWQRVSWKGIVPLMFLSNNAIILLGLEVRSHAQESEQPRAGSVACWAYLKEVSTQATRGWYNAETNVETKWKLSSHTTFQPPPISVFHHMSAIGQESVPNTKASALTASAAWFSTCDFQHVTMRPHVFWFSIIPSSFLIYSGTTLTWHCTIFYLLLAWFLSHRIASAFVGFISGSNVGPGSKGWGTIATLKGHGWSTLGLKWPKATPVFSLGASGDRPSKASRVYGSVSVKCKNLGRHRGYWQNQKDIEGSGPLVSSWLICCQEISKATRYLACRSGTSSELQWKFSIFKSAHTVCDTEIGLPGFQASQKEHAQLKVDCKFPGIMTSNIMPTANMFTYQPQRDQQSPVFLYQKQSQRWSHILNSAALLSWKHGLTYESRFGFSKPLAIVL